MAQFRGSIEQCTDLVLNGVVENFKRELRARFLAAAEPLIEEAAVAAAQNVVAHVESFYRFEKDRTEVHVSFNRKSLYEGRPNRE